MAISYAQSTTGGTTSLTVASVTTSAFGSSTTTGNTLAVFVATGGGQTVNISSCSDNMGNSYLPGVANLGFLTTIDTMASFCSVNITGGSSHTVSVAYSKTAAGCYTSIIVLELSGVAAFDNANGVGQLTKSTTPTPGAPIVTSADGDAIVAAFYSVSGTNTWSASSGFSNLVSATFSNGLLSTEYQVQALRGSSTPAMGTTLTNGSGYGPMTMSFIPIGAVVVRSTTLTNYQFVRVANGISTSEKIR